MCRVREIFVERKCGAFLRNSTFFPQLEWTITFSPGTMASEICLCIQQTKSATQRAGESHRDLRSLGLPQRIRNF